MVSRLNFIKNLLKYLIPESSRGEGTESTHHREGRVCREKTFIVDKVINSLTELEINEAMHFIRSYYSTLNLGFPLEIRALILPVNTEEYLSKLRRDIEKYQVTLEVNPSAEVKEKLRKLRKVMNRIVKEGLRPYDVIGVFIVRACGSDEEEVKRVLETRGRVLKNSLDALGIKVSELRGLKKKIIDDLFFRLRQGQDGFRLNPVIGVVLNRIKMRVTSYSGMFLYPFLLKARVNLGLRGSGIYLGLDLRSNERVYWNINESFAPHVLVVGPSGSGKTEFLATLGKRVNDLLGIPIVYFDVKGEYRERLWGRGVREVTELKLGKTHGLGLWYVARYLPKEARSGWLTDVITRTFNLSGVREVVSTLYNALSEVVEAGELNADWVDRTLERVRVFGDEFTSYKISEILNYLRPYENLTPFPYHIGTGRNHIILNLSYVLEVNPLVVSIVAEVIAKYFSVIMLRYGRGRGSGVRIALFLDEGWIILRDSNVVTSLVRMGRGLGIMVAIATQSLEDVLANTPDLIQNLGLLVVLYSPSRKYWSEVANYVKLGLPEIDELSMLSARGEGLVRISPDPRPLLVRLDVKS